MKSNNLDQQLQTFGHKRRPQKGYDEKEECSGSTKVQGGSQRGKEPSKKMQDLTIQEQARMFNIPQEFAKQHLAYQVQIYREHQKIERVAQTKQGEQIKLLVARPSQYQSYSTQSEHVMTKTQNIDDIRQKSSEFNTEKDARKYSTLQSLSKDWSDQFVDQSLMSLIDLKSQPWSLEKAEYLNKLLEKSEKSIEKQLQDFKQQIRKERRMLR